MKEFFDPAARGHAIPDLSLAGGAVRGWDRRNAYYFQLIQSLAKHYKFDIETPWNELPTKVQQVVLYGSGDRGHRVPLHRRQGQDARRRSTVFEGILPNLERRYRETESLHGARGTREVPRRAALPGLRRHAPQPRGALCVRGRPPAARDRASHGGPRARVLSRHSTLAGWRGEVATKIVKDVADRLRFLVDVGLDYLTLDRSAESLSGGEAQRIRLASQVGSGLTGVMYILDEPSIGLHQRDNRGCSAR